MNRSPIVAKIGVYFGCIGVLVCSVFAPISVYAVSKHETGVSTSATLLRMKDAELNKRLNDIQNIGATWIRIDFSWAAIQPNGPGSYNWKMYDRIVRVAGAHHLKVLAILDYTPKWARDPLCQAAAVNEDAAQKCSPRNNNEFARFAHAAALRFGRQAVRGWEIWNEPNLVAYWKSRQPDNTMFVDPSAYARVANAAAAEIRHYSDAPIITGGLSPLFEPTRARGMRQSDYLALLLPHLNKKLFDGVGLHPYSWPVLPTSPQSYNAFYTVNNDKPKYNLATIMHLAGWADKPVWGTEFGATTKGVHYVQNQTRNNRTDYVKEGDQASIISQGILNWYKKSNAGPLFIHSDSDQWLIQDPDTNGYGLRRSDGTKKPAYDAAKNAFQDIKK